MFLCKQKQKEDGRDKNILDFHINKKIRTKKRNLKNSKKTQKEKNKIKNNKHPIVELIKNSKNTVFNHVNPATII